MTARGHGHASFSTSTTAARTTARQCTRLEGGGGALDDPRAGAGRRITPDNVWDLVAMLARLRLAEAFFNLTLPFVHPDPSPDQGIGVDDFWQSLNFRFVA
ncbi:hypothetical protein [Micromonospora sp. C28ISP2-4]|uniref:hypothetical protein n=1 Tax=Micromonospora sp. C28ISP2-4 TaxID=3059523 RepID=UPI0026753FB3|nr:hypothetical protein [Micromonospora sp. C28ISP2-4]MDO3687758.1 hypothetical protein [Micromonospora sp. C28ISP2-4]